MGMDGVTLLPSDVQAEDDTVNRRRGVRTHVRGARRGIASPSAHRRPGKPRRGEARGAERGTAERAK